MMTGGALNKQDLGPMPHYLRPQGNLLIEIIYGEEIRN
jgi:hypothetical protein